MKNKGRGAEEQEGLDANAFIALRARQWAMGNRQWAMGNGQ